MFTSAYLRDRLKYHPHSGKFFWKDHEDLQRKDRVGYQAGALNSEGYTHIKIDGKFYYAAQLAWLYMYGEWPEELIDHKNRSRVDDRITNLRYTDYSQNQANRDIQKNNTTGVKGVCYEAKRKSRKKYRAFIMVNYKMKFLGYYETLDEAAIARATAAKATWGEYANATAP